MKKTYFRPEVEITAFTTEDIITASNVFIGGMTDGGAADVGSGKVDIDLGEGEWE